MRAFTGQQQKRTRTPLWAAAGVCLAGSQGQTKDTIDDTHESGWPQVNHPGLCQPLHFETALPEAGLPVAQRVSVALRPVLQRPRSQRCFRTPQSAQILWRG